MRALIKTRQKVAEATSRCNIQPPMPSIANAHSSEPHPVLATIGKGEGDRVGLILLRNNLGPHKLTNIGRGMGIEMASFGPFVFNGLVGSKPPPGITTRFAVFLASARA